MLYCIKNPENYKLKSFVCKYLKEIPISTHEVEGTFSVSNIRFYRYTVEIDVLFKGKIHGRRGRTKSLWLSSDVLNEKGVSKIRIYRYIRKSLIKKINARLAIFSIELRDYSYIKKLKWN